MPTTVDNETAVWARFPRMFGGGSNGFTTTGVDET